MPIWLLNILNLRKGIEFLAFYEEKLFCGFAYLVHHRKTTFIVYLATNPDIHSKGFGSKILKWIEKTYNQNEIVLNIETVSPNYGNYQQRLRRQHFYFKNGYYKMDFKIEDNGVIYDILSNSKTFSFDKYKKMIRYFSFGFRNVEPYFEKQI
ncbi:hypothetical protein IGI67_003769 [Enterococcus sp. AZ196]